MPAGASAATARSANTFVASIGVNTHTYYDTGPYDHYAAWRRKLLDSGIRYIRENLQVSSRRQVARMRNLYDARRIKASFIFDPRHDRGGSVAALAARLRSMPRAALQVEGPNEYENAHAGDWGSVVASARRYQAQLYDTVKSDPELSRLPVLGPSVANLTGYQAWGDLSGSLDVGNMHSYPGGRMPSANLAAWRTAARTTSGAKPVQATETGYHTALASDDGHLGVSERAAAIYVPRTHLEYFRAGVKRTFAYELIDEGSDTSQVEDSFGLLRSDLSDKPAMVALRNLIALVNDPGPSYTPTSALDYALIGAPSDVRHVLLQKRDGTYWLALWREISVWDRWARKDLYPPSAPVELSFGEPIVSATTYRPNDSVEPQLSIDGPSSVQVDVGPELTLVEITRAPKHRNRVLTRIP